MATARIIGPGRAGCSIAAALSAVGFDVSGPVARGEPVAGCAEGVDILILAVPDDEVGLVAALVRPTRDTLVVHLSGSLTLDVLVDHPIKASVHPLVPLPDPATGCARLLGGATFAVSGHPRGADLVSSLGGRIIQVAETDRPGYHAAACMASNHLVALMGQVERMAAEVDLPLTAFLGLARAALADVEALGPQDALTGPVRRGDVATLAAHRHEVAKLGEDDLAAYDASVSMARKLAAQNAAGSGFPKVEMIQPESLASLIVRSDAGPPASAVDATPALQREMEVVR